MQSVSSIPSSGMKGARALFGWNQAEAAAQLGVERSDLAAVEAVDNVDSDIELVLARYRDAGVSFKRSAGQLVVTRRTFLNETRDDVEGMAMAAARTAARFTQQGIATSAGVSLRTVAAFESGASVNRTTADALATALSRRHVEIVGTGNEWGFRLTDASRESGRTIGESEPPSELAPSFADAPYDPARPSFEVMRVDLPGTEPLVWRQICIPGNATFEDLHRAIQIAFGWRDQKAHEFDLGLRVGPAFLNDEGPVSLGKAIDERTVHLHDMSHDVRVFTYRYDGLNWEHRIQRLPHCGPGDRHSRPYVIGGRQAGPVEFTYGPEQYNEIASSLRDGTLGEKTGNWLQQLGYGRDYDPDAFSVERTDGRLAELTFDIASSWIDHSDHRRRIEAGDLPPPASITAPVKPRKPVGRGDLRIIEIEAFGEGRREKEGLGDGGRDGWGIIPSRKSSDPYTTRSLAVEILPNILEYAPDVASITGLPVKIVYETHGKRDALIPDLEVLLSSGSRLLVLAIGEEHLPQLDVLFQIGAELALRGKRLVLIPGGVTEAELFKVAHEIKWGDSPSYVPRDVEAATFLTELVARKPVKVPEAIRLMIEKGFTVHEGRIGGTPENRVLCRLLDCVAKGVISIDASNPDVGASSIGSPAVFAHTMSFEAFANQADYMEAPGRASHSRRGRTPKRGR